MKKLVVWLMVLFMAAMPVLAENADTLVLEKLEKLMFDESNVTLTASAEFTVDGELFKVFRGEYRQDGVNSYMDVSLDTPVVYGMSTGGFTVVANGDKVYSRDTYYGNYFIEGTCIEADTVLEKDAATSTAIYLLKSALKTLEEGGSTFFTEEDGKYILETEGAPALINALSAYFVRDYAEEQMYLGYRYEECTLYNDSVDTLIKKEYETVMGEEMPENFIEEAYLSDIDDEKWILYNNLYNAVMDRAYEEAKKYNGGILYLSETGEMSWYKDYSDYARALGFALVDYEDYHAAFAKYYENKFGQPYTDEMDMILAYTYNFDLWEAHVEEMTRMEEMYQAQADSVDNAVYMVVKADGSTVISERMPQKYEVGTETATRKLLRSMRMIEIENVVLEVTVDDEGRIVKGEGKASAAFINEEGERRIVGVTFSAEAKDYGNTSVKAFDPADYNSCMAEDYTGEDYGEMPEEDDSEEDDADAIANLPDTVTYAGIVYETSIVLP